VQRRWLFEHLLDVLVPAIVAFDQDLLDLVIAWNDGII